MNTSNCDRCGGTMRWHPLIERYECTQCHATREVEERA